MDLLAFIISERRKLLFYGDDAMIAGGVALLAALIFAIFEWFLRNRKGPSLMRSSSFWLLLLSGVGLIVVGVVADMQDRGGPLCEIGG